MTGRTEDLTPTQQWYRDYLNTDHWKRVRLRKISAAGHQCERCGEPGVELDDYWFGLHVHHLTYERIHAELLEDLEVLCVACHQVEHGMAEDTPELRDHWQRRARDRVAKIEVDNEIAAWDRLAADAAWAGF